MATEADGPVLVLAGAEESPLRELSAYREAGGYLQLERVRAMTPQAVTQELIDSNLRGRGGAFFPSGRKASFIPSPDKVAKPIYITVNADESEPGTFKDREIMLRVPHRLIEGCLIAAHAVQSRHVYIYIRGEYLEEFEVMQAAIDEARGAGILADVEIVIHRGAGAYICGEETALLESLEGERGMPRIRPPFPAIAGLYAKPTVVNNVETLSTVPHIVQMGGEEYAKLGVNRSTGTRIFSVSGHVNRPGNYEVELGMTFRDLLYGLAGGIRENRKVKFFIPGGASSQWLTGSDEHLDAPLDMDFVQQTFGVMLGSGAVMVYDETVDPLLVAWRLAKFFAHESCGKCTPCREGTGWIEKVLYRMSHGLGRPEDLDLLLSVGGNISPGVSNAPFVQTTICPLGPSSVSCVASLDKYFHDEVLERLRNDAGVPA
jgi:NADH-quinone oxidoreductase subunit F